MPSIDEFDDEMMNEMTTTTNSMTTYACNDEFNDSNDTINEAIIWNALGEDEGHIVLSLVAAAIINRGFECGHLQGIVPEIVG